MQSSATTFRLSDRLLHSGLRLVRIQPRQHAGSFRQRDASASARSRSTPCWLAAREPLARSSTCGSLKGKPDASMSGNGLLAGLVAITAPSGFVNPTGSAIIGFIAGVLVCLSVRLCGEHAESRRSGRRDLGARDLRPLGRAFGGLFADGTSNYGGTGTASLVR